MHYKHRSKFLISHFSFLILSAFFLTACGGYKPVSHYAKKTLRGPVYLDVRVSNKEPDNGPVLKDMLYKTITMRLGTSVTRDPNASSKLVVSYKDITYTALSHDTQGYVRRYRANVTVKFDLSTPHDVYSKSIEASHEADVTPSAIESSRIKRAAIAESMRKALDQFIAYVSTQGTKPQ